MDYSLLKSGTDIRGIASFLGGKTVNLTKTAVYDIIKAFSAWLDEIYQQHEKAFTIAVGHDSRITGEDISATVIKALTDSGINVIDCGLSSTPAMFMSTIDLDVDAAIEITASHHPFDRNGLKFFTKYGGVEGFDINRILELANEGVALKSDFCGTVRKENYMQTYAARLRKMICDETGKREEELPLKGFKIVVDAGNGVAGFYANDVLKKLGADISGSRYLEPDGMFPNHIPNPENAEAMKSICEAVLESKADLGLIFDTDVDRSACVGSDGKEINRNRLIALASYIATNGRKDSVIVTDSVTSDGLKEYIEKTLECKHYRYRRGYKNVINKAKEFTESGIDCPLAIETSGHAAFKENYFLDDGAYLATKIVIELAKGQNINNILATLKMPAEEKEVRIAINTDDFKEYGNKVLVEFEKHFSNIYNYKIADDNREGIRFATENGWFLLRLSVHDPVMVLNFESDISGGNEKIYAGLKDFFSKFELLSIINC